MHFRSYIEHVENKYAYFVEKLAAACKYSNAQLTTIGQASEYDIYSVCINPKADKCICFIGVVHGNETAGSHAILKYLEESKTPKNVRVLMYPVVNPIGFEHSTRTATSRLNINRQFHKNELDYESKLLRNSLLREKIDFLHTFHEEQYAGFYLYYGNKKNKTMCREIVKIAKEFFPIDKRKLIYGDKSESGLVFVDMDDKKPQNKNSLEAWIAKQGINYICTEMPMDGEAEKKATCGKEIMEYIIRKAL